MPPAESQTDRDQWKVIRDIGAKLADHEKGCEARHGEVKTALARIETRLHAVEMRFKTQQAWALALCASSVSGVLVYVAMQILN